MTIYFGPFDHVGDESLPSGRYTYEFKAQQNGDDWIVWAVAERDASE